MKTHHHIAGKIYAVFGVLTILLLAHPARAQSTNANEFWISTNATGNMLSSGAGGTIDSPLDGSTQPNFDANMNDLPPNSTVHVMAGTYETHGIQIKSGIKILGSGINVTVLQFPSGTPDNTCVISSHATSTNTEISDLTCDCNYISGSYTYHGIMLTGTKNAIRRVKLINASKMSSANSESWGLIIQNADLDHSDGNIIEECEVSGFNNALPGANQTAIGFISASGISEPVGIIRNNRVFGTESDTSLVFALLSQTGSIVEDNYVDGANVGSQSQNGETNVLYLHNIFRNCGTAIDFAGGSYRNLTFSFNQIEVTNAPNGGGAAFAFWGGPATATFTNIVMIGNNITCLGPTNSISSCYFNRIANVTGLTILDNTADSGLLNYITNCTNLNIDDNYDLYGNYLTGLNIPSVGGVPVSSFGLGFVGSAGAAQALTALGLPGNPLSIVTNNSTQPVIFDTNVTVAGSLNYSNMVAQLIAGTNVTTSTANTSTGEVVTVNATQTAYANEFWISTNATGNMLSSGASGTIDSPLDGSTQPNFDANMNYLPANCTVHVMAGLYLTHGVQVRSGVHILGSGIDITILQFPPGTPDSAVIQTAGQAGIFCTNNLVSDLTCDCNYTNSSSGAHRYAGVALEGTRCVIRNVKLLNPASTYTNYVEDFGLIISSQGNRYSDGNVIEGCEVDGFIGPTSDLIAIGYGSDNGYVEPSGIIRNNRIFELNSPSSLVFAFEIQNNDVVEGNYVTGVYSFYRGENAGTNVMIINNVMKNSMLFADLINPGYKNITFAYNQIEITNTFPIGQAFFIQGPATNIVLIGNNIISLATNTSGPSYFCRIYNSTGLTIFNNTMDASMLATISGCTNLNIDYNYDLYGNYLTNLNIPSVGGVPVTSFGLGLVTSAGASSTLTSLGLPSTPSAIVTNNSTGIMLSGAFGGNGGGLTNVTASYLAGIGPVGTNSDGTSFTFGGGGGIVSSLSFGTNSSATRNSLAFANGSSWDNSLAFAGGQARSDSLAFGINHSSGGAFGQYANASHGSLAFGYSGFDSAPFPYADSNSIAVGNGIAYINSFAIAGAASYVNSFGWGSSTTATNYSWAFGDYATAENYSLAFEGQAYAYSLAFGAWAHATNGSFAFCPVSNPSGNQAHATNFQWVAAGFTGGYMFNDGPFSIGNNLNVAGTISGNGSGLTGITGSSIATNAGISLNALGMPASTIAYGSNGVAAAAFLGPNLTIQNYTNVTGVVTNTGSTLLLKSFVSQEYSIASGVVANIPHGFSNAPSNVRWVVVCMTNDVGYAVGDELNVASVDANQYPAFSSGANSTNVFLIFDNNSSAFEIANKNTGTRQNGTIADWKAKCYASP